MKYFNWKEYLESRSDLEKNWNGRMRAFIHYYIISKYDNYIRPNIPMVISPAWRMVPRYRRKILLNKYADFKKGLKQTPNLFDLSPSKISFLEASEKKEYVLIIPLYGEEREDRRNEFLKCLEKNLAHKRIKKIVVFYDTRNLNKNTDALYNKIKDKNIILIDKKGRLIYEEAFNYANEHWPNSNIIVANADIYFNETLSMLDPIDMSNQFFCITRWNMQQNRKLKITYAIQGSMGQDAWIFKTPLKIDFKCDFAMGLNHCDTFINYHLQKSSALRVYNPCLDLRIYHLHLSNHRSKDLVELTKRDKKYVESQKLLGNYDAGIPFRRLNNDNAVEKENIPVFYHIPKCAGTFMKKNIVGKNIIRKVKKEYRQGVAPPRWH